MHEQEKTGMTLYPTKIENTQTMQENCPLFPKDCMLGIVVIYIWKIFLWLDLRRFPMQVV
jgi:hypothetical protein